MSLSALTCETSTATFTRNSTNLTSVVISADVDLTVHLVEADSFELSTSFYGRDSATSVCRESYAEDSTTWIIHVGASAPPPLRVVPPSTHRFFFNCAPPNRCNVVRADDCSLSCRERSMYRNGYCLRKQCSNALQVPLFHVLPADCPRTTMPLNLEKQRATTLAASRVLRWRPRIGRGSQRRAKACAIQVPRRLENFRAKTRSAQCCTTDLQGVQTATWPRLTRTSVLHRTHEVCILFTKFTCETFLVVVYIV
jgi:hypothetical protein